MLPWQRFSKGGVIEEEKKLTVDRAYAYLILRTSRLLRFHFHAMTSSLGIELSPEQWLVLNRLTHHDGLRQSELIDATFKDRPNVSRMLASLERKGLIRRKTDVDDNRRHCIHLTAKGRQLHEKLVPSVKRERKRVYKGLANKDFDALKRVLDSIDATLAKTLPWQHNSRRRRANGQNTRRSTA